MAAGITAQREFSSLRCLARHRYSISLASCFDILEMSTMESSVLTPTDLGIVGGLVVAGLGVAVLDEAEVDVGADGAGGGEPA